ncbi:hypothetical protein NBRC111894_1392 [Sporolactobacillus inulinus]|uniref:Uncharacterized protein n=1 Tax=Sporolactobacillus inulinus TaxID=2078 RepID=A0A4Y1ZAQ3_9BACL|nr:hypothetical protein NBRC111894_1392 [Sporolactobacillus inulinus]
MLWKKAIQTDTGLCKGTVVPVVVRNRAKNTFMISWNEQGKVQAGKLILQSN